MCGIAGIAYRPGASPRSREVLDRLAAALAHRGPDGAHVERRDGIDLVHTRLAIVDIAGGDQPLHAGCAALIANGEIYNDPAIRARLGDARFTTHSDCESALVAWQEDGPGFARALRGMYAIALDEGQDGRLLLARDPFGIKPLYIARLEDGVAFASEPMTLIRAGLVKADIRSEKPLELVQLQFTTGTQTIFDGIERVKPGETLEIHRGEIVSRRFVAATPAADAETIAEDKALARLDGALLDSVRAHERADVPFGLFLSGGIDSSCVLAAMTRLRRESSGSAPLLTWTAGFDVASAADETAHAAELARSVGAAHEIVRVTRSDFWTHLPAIVACMDDPVADYAIVPTWLLARKAREQVKVVLSGEGGDELFAGYGRYRRAAKPWWLGGRFMRKHGLLDGLDVLRERPASWRNGLTEAERACVGQDRLAAAQAVDVREWLPNDLLLKLDRCLMAHGLEGRTPLLDPVVAQVAWNLPAHLKIRNGQGKYLLRRWLEQELPSSRPFAPKQGFTVPVGAWIEEQGVQLGPLVARQTAVAGLARPDRVEALFRGASGRKEGLAAWALLFLALWHRIHIEGVSPDGCVSDTLRVY
ncbi:asparagine synthase (glutamine-hydrolyzing) [Acetobacter estunensis]|uniref:asparagine synthase (glutamine-hydrolyzing) n=1 Tax=Acetobacter estunensis TaxID=104097 RepID=A0A967B4B0_9PROT|nr:asparagine synthase (glutamine-hydrolyzing) [Acetobacter estunensis]NHO53495.1 asparagine synthase (glutamine-hydrolyzing) [Acetobacter estunensis]